MLLVSVLPSLRGTGSREGWRVSGMGKLPYQARTETVQLGLGWAGLSQGIAELLVSSSGTP